MPDYDDATAFLEQGRIRELELTFPDKSPQAHLTARQHGFRTPAELRAAILNQDRIGVARQALQLGVSPARFYYDLAKSRGYQPKQPAPARGGRSGRQGQSSGIDMNKLADLYLEDPDAFDREWDRWAATQR